MLEFMNELRKPHDTQDFSRINGLAYLKNGHIVYTPPRALEKDLDVFPMPAYDLLPIDRYGNRKGMWGDVISVYHSKGCIDQCNFCSCWRSGGKVKQQPPDGPLKFQNCWRNKSVDKTLEELKYIKDEWDKELYLFTDDSWNVNPKWNEEFAQKYKKDYDAFVDCVDSGDFAEEWIDYETDAKKVLSP